MPYVADEKFNLGKSTLKALRNFAILFGVIGGLAVALVHWAGWLGPLRLVEVTEQEALDRCQQAIVRQLGGAQLSEVSAINARLRSTGWIVTGSLITTGELGGHWRHQFNCNIETYHGTTGMGAQFQGIAQRID